MICENGNALQRQRKRVISHTKPYRSFDIDARCLASLLFGDAHNAHLVSCRARRARHRRLVLFLLCRVELGLFMLPAATSGSVPRVSMSPACAYIAKVIGIAVLPHLAVRHYNHHQNLPESKWFAFSGGNLVR